MSNKSKIFPKKLLRMLNFYYLCVTMKRYSATSVA